MTMTPLRVSLVQGATRWHDPAANRAYYGALVRALKGQGDLIVLPETFLSGFTNETLGNAETMDGAGIAWLRDLAAEVGCVITGSLVVREGDRCVNRLIWMRPDGTMATYDKRHLFRMAREQEHYAPGEQRLIVELQGWKVCPLVCYDLRFPVWSRNRIGTNQGYDLVLYIANWPEQRRYAWQTLLKARAIENLCYCIGVNRVGQDGKDFNYTGDSAAIDFLGRPMAEPSEAPFVATVTLDRAALDEFRTRFPAHLDSDEFRVN